MDALKLEPLTAFDPRAEDELAAVGPVGFYRSEQSQKLASLFAVTWQGERVGSVLLRVEQEPTGAHVMVIVAAVADTPRPVAIMGASLIEKMARRAGCTKMRVHTTRPGLAVQLMRSTNAEAVINWSVPNGR